jgi:hypothetical protein
LQIALQGLWLSGAHEGISAALFDEIIDPLQRPQVGILPVEIVFPALMRKDEFRG